jgi:uroporphyrinogen-III decarboxylase
MNPMTTMTSRERVRAAISHRQPDRVPIDFGSTFITGIHCSVVAELRDYYGLEKRLVKVCEPYQMLGLVEDDLLDAMGEDVVSIFPRYTIFGFPNENWKTWRCPWGQEVLVSEHFKTYENANGVYIHPKGDTTAPASGHMPTTGYFFDSIIRQEPIDEDNLDPAYNLEEFKIMSEEDLRYWRSEADRLRGGDRAVITHLNGTCLGDIALVPAPFLTHPKGIRDVAEWYMATAVNQEYVNEIFARQTEIALKNLELLHGAVGEVLDVVVVCGTDFGTQESSFCSTGTFDHLWLPHYRKMNDWIHQHTQWKTFKHSCGAVEEFIPHFVDAGFDILNPVQCSARGMSEEILKERHGDRITFWGGGVNTQKTLPFGTPEEVRAEVLRRCEVFSPGGGFVFNTIHNIQALTPVQNVTSMVAALREFNGEI